MPVSSWSTTAGLNVLSSGTSGTGGVNIDEGWAPSGVNNAVRDIMAQIATLVTDANFVLTSTDAGATANPTLTLYRNSASPAAADIIGKVLFQGEDSAGNTEDYAEVYAVIDDPTSTSEDGSLLFRTKVAGTMTTLMTLNANGLILPQGSAPAQTVEGAMQWDTDDDCIVVGTGSASKIFGLSGTYTPTLTNSTNIAASTAAVCQYLRVGNIVMVSGSVSVDPTAAAPTVSAFAMSLPIASNFAATNQLGGAGNAVNITEPWAIAGDVSNDFALFTGQAQTASNHVITFSFMYLVI